MQTPLEPAQLKKTPDGASALLGENEDEAEKGEDGEKAKLKVLSSAKEAISDPESLTPWHDHQEGGGKAEEKASTQEPCG